MELQACTFFPRPIVSHDPLSPQEHVMLGQSYTAQGLNDHAAREFQAALRQERHYVPALVALGNLSFESGTPDQAEWYFRQALEVEPHHAGANNNLAMVFLARNERLDEVERLAQQALDHAGALRPYVLDTLATLYVQQARYHEAKVLLDEAEATVSPDTPALYERFAQLRRELNAAFSPR
jgi:Tfp pilus assembly protein PilF